MESWQRLIQERPIAYLGYRLTYCTRYSSEVLPLHDYCISTQVTSPNNSSIWNLWLPVAGKLLLLETER